MLLMLVGIRVRSCWNWFIKGGMIRVIIIIRVNSRMMIVRGMDNCFLMFCCWNYWERWLKLLVSIIVVNSSSNNWWICYRIVFIKRRLIKLDYWVKVMVFFFFVIFVVLIKWRLLVLE